MKYTKVFIPKPIVEWFMVVRFDWKLFGTRINKEQYYNEKGYLELEVPNDKLEYWEDSLKDALQGCVYYVHTPVNIDFNEIL